MQPPRPAFIHILDDALASLKARRPAEALATLSQLPAHLQRDPKVLSRKAFALALQGRLSHALRSAQDALDRATDVETFDLIGNSLVLCHKPTLAHESFTRAAALCPNDPQILFNLATTLRFLGRAAEAEAAYDRVIAQAPSFWAAYRNRSELRRQTPCGNHIDVLTDALQCGPPWQGEVQLAYALGKEYEDMEAYDHAFQYIQRGASVRRAHMRYSVADDVGTLARIKRTFDAAYCAPARRVHDAPGPIFILGMPRTGSTLLERMLGRHSQVQPLGEIQNFSQAVVAAVRGAASPMPAGKDALIQASATVAPEQIGRTYLDAIEPLRDSRAAFVDKLPLNFLYVGLIARALPSARIVVMTRDPVDTCWAIYKTLFDEAYPFSYDLSELGVYHRAYHDLMAHWRDVLGSRVIDVAYERLVADPASTLPGVFDRLGLRFEPACLETSGAAPPVMTGSASQVLSPVHSRSVGLGRRYHQSLQPLLDALFM